MPIRRPNAFRLVAPLAAALIALSGCSDGPTAPDPLDAESLASRLEALSRQAPENDRLLLGAAGGHFRAAGHVTPITVFVDGQRETWYAATSEVVFPPLPCLPPSSGFLCPAPVGIELRHIYAVDGVDASRLILITTSTAGGGSFGQDNLEWPAPRLTTGILLTRGTGVTAFATAGSATSSLVETLGECRRVPPPPTPTMPGTESCERVSIAWEVDARMTPFPAGEMAPTAIDVVIPSVEVLGSRMVFEPLTLPPR